MENDRQEMITAGSIEVFHAGNASLGEGLLLDEAGCRVFWLDINLGLIYVKGFDGSGYREYEVGHRPGALLRLDNSTLTFCHANGLAQLNVETGLIANLSDNPELANRQDFRSNDGVCLPGGSIIYGTMQCVPTGVNGGLYYYNGRTTKSLAVKIGIPNGFIVLNDTDILIADSYTRKMNQFNLDTRTVELRFERCWHDFSLEDLTPDGGCTDGKSGVYVALWDGFGIAALSPAGELLRVFDLPVPRTTNCKLANDGKLYITSATEGLSDSQLTQYPLSGSVLTMKLDAVH